MPPENDPAPEAPDVPTPEVTPEPPAPADPPTAPEAPPAESAPETPWQKDLEAQFTDETVRNQVNEFLGSKVQPYVTKLEQESAPSRDAQKLWDDFISDPVNTYRSVTEELFGEETSEKITGVLSNATGQEPDAAQAAAQVDAGDVDAAELPPELREVVEHFQQEKRTKAYGEEFDRVKGSEEFKDVAIDKDLFHPFVVAADGDFDIAAAGYKQWHDQASAKFGLNPPSPDQIQDAPPPTIGQATPSGGNPPPVVKQDQTLDDALDDFFTEQKTPPTTVGPV